MARPPSSTRSDDGALFRIHRVSELTGVAEVTLRAWERRYGIPTPRRTSAGYRLYGEREVAQVREMLRLTKGGQSTAEAAVAVKKRENAAAEAPSRRESSPFERAVTQILRAVERFDDEGLDVAIARVAFVAQPLVLLDEVLAPALVRIGESWARGDISVAQEHFASQRIGTFMRSLLRTMPGARADRRAVVACFGDDEHEIGLVGLAMHLSEWGIRPVLLGSRTPPSAIAEARSALEPIMIALSATVAPREGTDVAALCREYRDAARGVPWFVGGAYARWLSGPVEAAGGEIATGNPAALRSRFETGAR